MRDGDIVKLVKLVEKQVVAALIANGYVKHDEGELKFENIIINDDIITSLKLNKNETKNQEFLDELIEIFPKGYRCSKEQLADRLKKFYLKTSVEDITEDEILVAATSHINKYLPPYCGKLFNFIYKVENGTYTSRLEDEININRESDESAVMYSADKSESVEVLGWKL